MFHLSNDFKFTNQEMIMPIANDIKQVYANHFCDSDIVKAKEQLEKTNYSMQQSDVAILSFMLGGIAIFIVFILYLLHLEGDIF